MNRSLSRYCLIALLFLTGSATFSQGGFKKKYFLSNSLTSVCHDVMEIPGGNLLMLGITVDTVDNNPFNRLTLVSTDSQGNLLWRKNYGNIKFQYLDNSVTRGLVKDNTGFYFTCPVLDSTNRYYSTLIRFNFNGDTLWQKTYKHTVYNPITQDVTKTVDGGLFLTGFAQYVTANQPLLFIKTDIFGNELWRKLVNSSNSNPIWSGCKSVQDSVTKIFVSIGFQSNGGQTESLVVATDSLCTLLWKTSFNNQGGGALGDLIQTNDKNFVTCGSMNSNNDLGLYTRYRSVAVKFDINGNMIWRKTYDTISPYAGMNVLNELPNGDLIMGAGLDTNLNHNFLPANVKLRLIKSDKDGNLKWKKYSGSVNSFETSEYLRGMNPTQDGGFVIASYLPFASVCPYRIVKIDSTGCDTTEAYCQSIATSIGKFTQVTGWEMQVYPNPADDLVNVSVIAPHNKQLFLKISDLSSREIEILKVETGKIHQINISHLSPGVYLLSVEEHSKTLITKRLVIAR